MKSLAKTLNHWLPPFLVLTISCFVFYTNAHLSEGKSLSGWDNILTEFDLWEYTQRVIGGAWLEHQGLGAPMSLAYLAEIPRLPILWIFHTILPANSVRTVFIFTMYGLGGLNMYWFLLKKWLSRKTQWINSWLAATGSTLYLLHVLTLQQFYIILEMFAIQFAFFPLLLMSIHQFEQKVTSKSILLFTVVQLLLAPSGHTPTNFYLAALFSILYSFFVGIKHGLNKAVKNVLIVSFLTFFINSYWILPNVYYVITHSNYVHDSHSNQVFAPESISSVKEAGTLVNFIRGTQYLFEWSDYNFKTHQHELIFNEWKIHLSHPLTFAITSLIGLITLLGVATVAVDKSKGEKRWAILSIYVFSAIFIWMGFFPLDWFFDFLYSSAVFTEIFRNPFTKLSIIYTAVSVMLFISVLEMTIYSIKKSSNSLGSLMAVTLITTTVAAVCFSALPSFSGHFISEKLFVNYPQQYFDLFLFLKSKKRDQRLLALPQPSSAGWEYFDWQFVNEGNGYQGMGFYFFGMNQPVLHRDFDRWIESSDSFYHELRYAVDSQDPTYFEQVVSKYHVQLILVDETRVEPGLDIIYSDYHQMAEKAGFIPIWRKDFLTLYERTDSSSFVGIQTPTSIGLANHKSVRSIFDVAYNDLGPYIHPNENDGTYYPFSDLLTKEISNASVNNHTLSLDWSPEQVISGQVRLFFPKPSHVVPVMISYQSGKLKFDFLQVSILVNNQSYDFSLLEDREYSLANSPQSILVIIDKKAIQVNNNQTLFTQVDISNEERLTLNYAPTPPQLQLTTSNSIDRQSLDVHLLETIDLAYKFNPTIIVIESDIYSVKAKIAFPPIVADLTGLSSENCSQNPRGAISTNKSDTKQGVTYVATDFGVNCNGVPILGISNSSEFLLNVEGSNNLGRGIKLFVNKNSHTLPADFVFNSQHYNTFLTMPHFFPLQESPIYLNWEVRSFGQLASSRLDNLSIMAFPIQQLSGFSLTPVDENIILTNDVTVSATRHIPGIGLMVKFNCQSRDCVVGLDQSHDRMWIAVSRNGLVLPHLRLNSYANAWKVNGNDFMIVMYVPQLVANFSVALVGIFSLSILIKYCNEQLNQK